LTPGTQASPFFLFIENKQVTLHISVKMTKLNPQKIWLLQVEEEKKKKPHLGSKL
jgi:hypothetical protein